MEVILLERVGKLGHMGDTVRVKDGYARNFLLAARQGVARHRGQQEEVRKPARRPRSAQPRDEARGAATSPRRSTARASSSSARRARPASSTARFRRATSPRRSPPRGFPVHRNQVALLHPIKTLGLHKTPIHLHPEVEAFVTINVARSPEQAERQAKGEDLNVREETSMDDLGLEVGQALADAGPGESLARNNRAERLSGAAGGRACRRRSGEAEFADVAIGLARRAARQGLKWRRLGESGKRCGSRHRPAWAP